MVAAHWVEDGPDPARRVYWLRRRLARWCDEVRLEAHQWGKSGRAVTPLLRHGIVWFRRDQGQKRGR